MNGFVVFVLSAVLTAVASALAFVWIGYWVAQGVRLAGGLGV
jgi:hypothetical protein